jgi:hypothetical protein
MRWAMGFPSERSVEMSSFIGGETNPCSAIL